MTAKEALKRIVSEINNHKLHGIGDGNWLGFQDVLSDVKLIEQALTELEELKVTPTEQEVCEALSKHYHSVWYKKNEDDFIYLGGKFLQNEYIITLDKLKQRGLYEEIILMAKFYKGKVKE